MPSLDGKFVVGISSSALFDTKHADKIFKKIGKDAYIAHQINREKIAFPKGTAFSLIEALLQLNPPQTEEEKRKNDLQLVEVIIFSHTEPAAALRAMNSVEYYRLPITRAAFVGGAPLVPYLPPYQVSLFLSKDEKDVRAALEQKIPAAILHDPPEACTLDSTQLRIAFDGDAVLFDDEAEKIYNEKGAQAFFQHEREKAHANDPLKAGPFAPFLKWLIQLKKTKLPHLIHDDPVKIALVTARNSPAHERVILTLRAWGTEMDQIFFQGGLEKRDILRVFAPHIFFDDQKKNTSSAAIAVPAAHVPFGVKNKAAVPALECVIVTQPPEADLIETVPVETQVPAQVPTETSVRGEAPLILSVQVTPLSEDAFEQQCRLIFRHYTPMSSGKKNVILSPRYRDFITKNKKTKTPEQRGRIALDLSRYDLSDLVTHEPLLNREREDVVARKLSKIAGDPEMQQALELS